MFLFRNWALALASAFALWSALPSVAGAMTAGTGARSALENIAPAGIQITQVRHGTCGRRCYSGRGSYRGPRADRSVRGAQAPRRYNPRIRGNSARPNSRVAARSAYRGSKQRGPRSYRSYSHYRKDCRRYCGRYKHRRKHYGYYRSGWWYSWPWWSLSVPIYVYSDVGYRNNELHVAYCLGKYRSYDPYTDTYVAYSGKVRRCRSPYSGY